MMPSFTCVSPAQLACQTRITPSTVCVGAALNVPVRCHQRQGHRAIGRTQLEQDSWSSDLGAYLHLSRRAGEVNRGALWSLIAKRQREAGVLFDRYVVLASLFQPRDLRLMVTDARAVNCPRWASLLIGS